MDEHECRCASLPVAWPRKCGAMTQSIWSQGCDATQMENALNHLGFKSRLEFIEWAAGQPEGLRSR
jgi:hypothetical protein